MRSMLLTVSVVFIVAAGCLGGQGKQSSPSPSPSAVADAAPRQLYVVATDVASPDSEGVFKFRQTGGATTFAGKKDEPLNLTIKNAVGNQYVHNLVLDGYGVKLIGVKDTTVSTIFNLTKTGSFKFYCDLTTGAVSHRQMGMEGTLTVS